MEPRTDGRMWNLELTAECGTYRIDGRMWNLELLQQYFDYVQSKIVAKLHLVLCWLSYELQFPVHKRYLLQRTTVKRIPKLMKNAFDEFQKMSVYKTFEITQKTLYYLNVRSDKKTEFPMSAASMSR